MTLCIDQLQADRVSLQFPPGDDSSSGPVSLPDLKLPLALDSRPPSDALAETLLNEQRFRRLNAQQPEVAERLWKEASADLQKRYEFLAQLAGKVEKPTIES